MADNVDITAGSGTTIATDDCGAAGHTQIVKLAVSTDGSATPVPADATNGLDVDVTRLPALPAGTNNIGDVDVLTVPADPFGTNADAASATGSVSAKLRFIAATGIPITALPASTNTIETVGDAAHDAVAAGNPVLMGGFASAAAPTNVSADGDAVRAWYLRNGAAASVLTAAGALIGGDATNGLDVDVTRLPALPAGTNNIGDVDVLTLPTLPQLPAALVGARLDTNNGAWLGSTAPTVGQKTMANSIPVTLASDQAALTGTLANGAQTAVSSTAVSVLAANANRKCAIIQNVGSANIRVGVTGVTATTGMQLVPGGTLILETPFIPTAAVFAIREGAVDSTVLAQEIT